MPSPRRCARSSWPPSRRRRPEARYHGGRATLMRNLARTSAPDPAPARPGPSAAGGPDRPLRIGVSACLLGENVRYDGGHKRDTFLVGTLGRFVEWVPVCPEVELGLGTPRDTLRL